MITLFSSLGPGFTTALEFITQGADQLTPEAIQAAIQLYAAAADDVITPAEANQIAASLPDSIVGGFKARFTAAAKDGQVTFGISFTLKDFLTPSSRVPAAQS